MKNYTINKNIKTIINRYGYIKDLKNIENFKKYMNKRYEHEIMNQQVTNEMKHSLSFFKENLIVDRGGLVNYNIFEPEIKSFLEKKIIFENDGKWYFK